MSSTSIGIGEQLNRHKLLILSSKTGGGHLSLAASLRDRLEHAFTVEIVDPLPDIFYQHYRYVSRHMRWLWKAEYQVSNTPARALFIHQGFTILFASLLKSVLDRVQPNLIITVHPFLTHGVMRVLENCTTKIPFVIFLSELSNIHALSLNEQRAALNLAPTHEIYAQAVMAGFPTTSLCNVGWPVRRQFQRTGELTRAEMLNKLHLAPHRFTVFLQGGGDGTARFVRTIDTLLNTSQEVQVILAVGTNYSLLTRYQGRRNLYAFSFTEDIAPFMAAADVVIGKIGPNALFEAIALDKPFIATTYIPGQEEANLKFIQRHNLGWVALEPEELRELIKTFITAPSVLYSKARDVHQYRSWNFAANDTIASLIQALV